jgi:hypothetical protein
LTRLAASWSNRFVDSESWEGIAADVLEATGCDTPPVSALELAACCGIAVRLRPIARARMVRDTIEVSASVRPRRMHGLIAHELGHWALARAGEPDSELAARYLAGALMLPRRAFDRDLVTTGWSLEELQLRHPHASAEMIARRVTTMRDAVASIWDQGRCSARVASPWLDELAVGARPSRLERQLVERALERAEVQHPAPLVWALPVIDGPHRRVVVVLEAEQLALRW